MSSAVSQSANDQGRNLQSVTTIVEDDKRESNCPFEVIFTRLDDMVGRVRGDKGDVCDQRKGGELRVT